MSPELRPGVYSAQEIRKHSLPLDLWMTIHGKVYDVTAFAQEHPGGVEVLLDCGGVDATEAFDDVAHSDLAREMLEPYFVGFAESAHRENTKEVSDPEKAPEAAAKCTKRNDKLRDFRRQKTCALVLAGVALLCVIVVMILQKIQWVSLIQR